MYPRHFLCLALLLSTAAHAETLAEIGARVGKDTTEAFAACRFMEPSRDFASRYERDPEAKPTKDEVAVDASWRVLHAADADPLVAKMGGELVDFLSRHMGEAVTLEAVTAEALAAPPAKCIVLLGEGGGTPGEAESYTIAVSTDAIAVHGGDAHGLRDGVVRLVDRMGFRAAPFVALGEETRAPRLPVRLGPMTSGGSYRETVFLGYNAVLAGGGSLHALSRSNAIPELAVRRVEGMPEANKAAADKAREWGLKTFAFLDMRQKFPKDDPIFAAHPDLRGALTWKADGEYVLCTEHALMQQWMEESIEGLYRNDPQLDGIVVIIGGEGFYHCYMRPYNVEKGHTNCARCEPLGAEQTVANLVNRMARAARRVNPKAEVVIWPYSAEHVWAADKTQEKLIEKLEPGVALLTEIEKDEYLDKGQGIKKHLWDYSIDLIGPGERAKAQLAACKARGISCYLKSEPESVFEAPRLPHIPSMDRWWDRADALVTCGATGAWVFPAFRGCYGTSATEVNKLNWWSPNQGKDAELLALATRIGGSEAAGREIREAWRKVSEAIPYSPEIPAYYTGPYYLGPAQPMICDPNAAVPEVFNGYYLFMAEISDDEGVKKRPTYYTKPSGKVRVFRDFYRQMEALLKEAAAHMDAAQPQVPQHARLMFDAEYSVVQWFYRTVRSEANFYQSCMYREDLRELAEQPSRTPEEQAEAAKMIDDWLALLRDEKENTEAAIPLIQNDIRIDAYYGGDHTFSHTEDMLRAKLKIMEGEINTYVPGLRDKVK